MTFVIEMPEPDRSKLSRNPPSVTLLHPRATRQHLGYIPLFFDERDARSAKDQINERYIFGGWQPFTGPTLDENMAMCYSNDPPQPALAVIRLSTERVFIYPHAFVAIVQANGTAEFARLD